MRKLLPHQVSNSTSSGSKPVLPPLESGVGENAEVEGGNSEAKEDSSQPSEGDDGKKDMNVMNRVSTILKQRN